jgi:hypothetical protein
VSKLVNDLTEDLLDERQTNKSVTPSPVRYVTALTESLHLCPAVTIKVEGSPANGAMVSYSHIEMPGLPFVKRAGAVSQEQVLKWLRRCDSQVVGYSVSDSDGL